MTPLHRRVRRPFRRRALAIAVCACLAATVTLPAASGSPQVAGGTAEALSVPAEGVRVDTGPVSVPADGTFLVDVSVDVDEPVSYLEIRFQLRHPGGRLIFQRTEVRSDVEAGTVDVEFGRALDDLDLRPEAYPYEVRVRAQAEDVIERKATGHILVHAPEPDVTRVALGARISPAPRFDAQGNFVTDPARGTHALEQAELLARAVLDDPALRLTLAISPVTLDEWASVSRGYLLADPDRGLVEAGADEPGPLRYAAAIRLLRDAVATGRLELLTVGYADPDVAALDASGRIADLHAHFERGAAAYRATLETSPSAGVAVASDTISGDALDALPDAVEFIVLAPEPFEAAGTAVPAGVHPVDGAPLSAVVIDRGVCDMVETGSGSAGALSVFEHAISDDHDQPIMTLTDVGPGRSGTAQTVVEIAGYLRDAAWAELVTSSELLDQPTGGEPILLPDAEDGAVAAPPGYWEDAARARRYAAGLLAAAGPADPHAREATDASLIAQSSRWAGADGRWGAADRGRAFAAQAERVSREVLEQVSVAINDVTLAGPTGDVPISLFNGSDKELTVTLRLTGDDMEVRGDAEETLVLSPQENFHTVTVDLGSALSGTLGVEAWAGDVLVAEGSSAVRASYLDRLAVVAGVTMLLLVLLLFIRRRVRSASAATIRDEDASVPRKDVRV
ncbi:MAG TPA: hypothetical protein VFH17_03110 [Coriobacteriia bacterium]|nr:hypothetical protein [Coriobacteriia bacterium]